jgi:NAD/NADP transhydrogenase alpha subunit
VRPAVKEQVESLGGEFVKVAHSEDGSGAGGYAKEMSAEWHAAARHALEQQCRECDIVITTARRGTDIRSRGSWLEAK